MKTVSSVAKVSNNMVNVLSGVRAQMVANNPGFDSRLPAVTQDSLKDFGEAVLSYQPAQNEFIDTLVNMIGKVWITNKMFTNPLRSLKKGMLEFGDTVEIVYTNLVKAHNFDPEQAESEWMKREIPDVSTAFAKRNYQLFYKATISEDMLRSAFMSWNGLGNFINSIFQQMYNGAENDEFKSILELLNNYSKANKFAVVKVDEITDDATARSALAKIKAVSNKMAFMRNDYNSLGVITNAPKDKQVLIIDADFDALLDVQAYAMLFNLDPARAEYRKIVIDEFPEDLKTKKVHAILIDEDFYGCWDNLTKFTKDVNGQGLYWQYWAHYWRILSIVPFANAVAFTSGASTVTAVTVTPDTKNVAPGHTEQMTATVTGTGAFSGAVEWSISGNSDETTIISPLGLLYVGKNETGPVTVTATSVQDSTKSGTARITSGK